MAEIEWPEGLRPCHELRVSGAKHDADGNMQEAKMLTKYDWSDPRVAQRYINLADVVFRDEADALERRLLGTPSTASSTDLSEPEMIEGDAGARSEAVLDLGRPA